MDRILILGGYGNTGRQVAEQLLRHTAVRLVLAGRRVERAEEAAAKLNAQFGEERVTGAFADAADADSLRRAFAGVDVVVVAASTAAWARKVAEAALAARVDYLDVHYSAQKTAVLHGMAEEIRAAGCCFVTDGGFHPGLPAALIRAVAPCFDEMQSAIVGSVIKIDWGALDLGRETMVEFVGEFVDFRTTVFRGGRWQEAGLGAMMKPLVLDFGWGFGRQPCVPMFLEEMRTIPELYPGIEETGFYVGGFNWFTDWLVSPLAMLVLKLAPRRGLWPMARLFRWSLDAFSRPPFGTLLRVEARGRQGGREKDVALTLYHEDGYTVTAVPVAATLTQLLDGSARRPGLHLQAHLVAPGRLLRDMERMGIEIRIEGDGDDEEGAWQGLIEKEWRRKTT